MAEARDDFYRDVVRAGYRGAVPARDRRRRRRGHARPRGARRPQRLPDEEVAERLLALPGVGPYAAAHVMMLLGRYSPPDPRLLDAADVRAPAPAARRSDPTIERRFRRYGEFAGLAFWLYLTRDWVPEA